MALINTTTTGVLGSTFYGDGTGSLTVQQNGVTLGIYGNIPTFSYGHTSSITLTNSAATKLTHTVAEWDTTNGMFASSRFTPTIAGYYQINAATCTVNTGNSYTMIYKNGSEFKRGTQTQTVTGAVTFIAAALVFCNGTTDYIEHYFSNNSGTNGTSITGAPLTYFQGILVKAA